MAYHKPFVIRDALAQHFGPVVYCDADAIPIKADPSLDWSFDVAVTIRRTPEIECRRRTMGLARDQCDGWINAGVMFFNSNPESRWFVEQWMTATRRYRNDQIALNKMLGGNGDRRPTGDRKFGHAKVRSLDAGTYNCYYFGVSATDEGVDPAEAWILHFKGDRRYMLPQFRHLLDVD
ncbi:putative nucleotide-diphospho-sugar transferase [Pseudomonadota bacterium]